MGGLSMRVHAIVFGLIIAATAPQALADEWTVAENNRIVQIYVGRTTPEGTELVFELASMHFYSNQRLYGCIFVSGQIAYIKEYNNEDSYVRAVVKLPADGELVAYSGVVKAPERIDPHNHAALWQTFVNSAHKPFKARREDLPEWYVINPIKARKARNAQPVKKRSPGLGTYPYLKPEERAARAKEALDPLTGDRARFYAVWGLAISGYTPEGAEALAKIASAGKYGPTTRGYAGMGLRNFSSAMPEDVRKAIQNRLYVTLEAEKDKLPDGVMRTLVAWGGGDRVREVLGGKLRGHPMEMEVLDGLSSREEAVAALWELYQTAPPIGSSAGWNRRWRIGAALVHQKDKRGIDVMMECFTVKEPWPVKNPTPRAEAVNIQSFHQCRLGTFTLVARTIDEDFGYESSSTWSPQLDEAIAKMVEWWKAHRETWNFEEATSTVVPTVKPGKVLTKRQARVLAAKLANDAFAERTFLHPNGKPVGKIEIRPESFSQVRQRDGRWVLRMVVSAGPEAFVDFAVDGTDAKVTVNYAWR